MKKTLSYEVEGRTVEREVNDIPVRFILAIVLAVLLIPVAGFMMYFLFYDRKLHKRYVKRLNAMKSQGHKPDDLGLFASLAKESLEAHNQAKMLCNISESHLYSDTKQEYFPLGEDRGFFVSSFC